MWSDGQKIGVGLTCAGVFFMFLGVISFFDSGLLTIGNILFIAGMPLTIGVQRTVGFFTQKKRIWYHLFFNRFYTCLLSMDYYWYAYRNIWYLELIW
ncbi:unnamed protein product [Cunninghamella echinulata]